MSVRLPDNTKPNSRVIIGPMYSIMNSCIYCGFYGFVWQLRSQILQGYLELVLGTVLGNSFAKDEDISAIKGSNSS